MEKIVQQEIVRVYEKKEDTENEKGEMDNAKRKEGEEGTAEFIPPPMSRMGSERKREENNKQILIQTKNDRQDWWAISMQMWNQMRRKQVRPTKCRRGPNHQEFG